MSTPRKAGKPSYIPQQKTVAFREQMRIGAAIADQLDKRKGLTEVGRALGISDTMVRRIECQALWKLQAKLKELMAAAGGEV